MDNETCQVTSDACSNGSSPAVTVHLPTVDDSNSTREEKTTKKGRRKGSKGKRTMANGDTACRTVYTLGNPLTNWYSVTCVNRGYTQSASGKTGKTLSAFGPARHVGNYRC